MNSVDATMILLRVIHILSGVFWAGATFFLVGFLQPVVAASGPEGGRLMQRLTSQKRFQMAMPVAAGLTILSGLALYGRVSAGFQIAWITSGTGLVLALSSVAAILAVVTGGVVQRPMATRLQVLAGEVQGSGAPPRPAQMGEMRRLQRRISSISLWIVLLLIVAVVGMASARYVRI